MAKVWSKSQIKAFEEYEAATGEKLTEEDKELMEEYILVDEPMTLDEIREIAIHNIERERRKKQKK